jgi:hypothetical protein
MPFLKHILLLMAVLSLIAIANPAMAQEENMLINGSFEDLPQCCEAPNGWTSCGSPDETAPDIQPGSFGVKLYPYDGDTYLGMVVRDNDTRESVGQELVQPLKKDSLYILKVALAYSKDLESLSKLFGSRAFYDTPVKLAVYGGLISCDSDELLALSNRIMHSNWVEYEFYFTPFQNYNYIILETEFDPEYYTTPYNGNLLLDNCSLTKIN